MKRSTACDILSEGICSLRGDATRHPSAFHQQCHLRVATNSSRTVLGRSTLTTESMIKPKETAARDSVFKETREKYSLQSSKAHISRLELMPTAIQSPRPKREPQRMFIISYSSTVKGPKFTKTFRNRPFWLAKWFDRVFFCCLSVVFASPCCRDPWFFGFCLSV